MDQTKIGNFIAFLRKEQNLTQRELAERLGVTDRAVSKWENGRGMPDISLMRALCEELGISINELLSGERLDASSYQEKAEENITVLMQRKSYKALAVQVGISTAVFLLCLCVFPLAAEKLVAPLIIPIILFWSILLIVGNFLAGLTYGIVKKWGKLRLIVTVVYHILLLFVLITLFAIASVVFTVL